MENTHLDRKTSSPELPRAWAPRKANPCKGPKTLTQVVSRKEIPKSNRAP